jgi:hypothetical protein
MTTASAAVIASSLPTMAQTTAPSLIHHVFFWLKNPGSTEDRIKLLEGLKTLSKIESLRDFRLGESAATEKREVIDSSYTFSLFTVFDDIKGHDAYQIHPIHLAFVDGYKHLWDKVQVYDVQSIR